VPGRRGVIGTEGEVQRQVTVGSDPMPGMKGLDHILQRLSWPGEVGLREGKIMIFYLIRMVISPLLPRPMGHLLDGVVGFDVL